LSTELSCVIVTMGPGPSGERRKSFRQPPGPNDDPVLASYVRIAKHELEAGGLN
jgi:hypothetical protein